MSNAIRVSKGAWALLRYFEALHRIGGWIAPGIDFLARRFSRPRGTILRWLGELKRAGRLASRQRGHLSAVYTLLRPLNETSVQQYLFTELPKESPSEKQNHRDDAARKKPQIPNAGKPTDSEEELLRLAGVPRKPANLAALRESLSVAPIEQVRGGIALGRVRRMCAKGIREPIHSLRYFSGSIAEAATLPMGYLEHCLGWLRRHGVAA